MIKEGYKSFPSGHTSCNSTEHSLLYISLCQFPFQVCSSTSCPVPCRLAGSFAGLGFLSWYLAGKIKAFDRGGHVAKLCIVAMPLLLAAMVAVSRVDDYWHHWQDASVRMLLFN